ncbi:hypothetical protein, partial [Staphylococcus aureus]
EVRVDTDSRLASKRDLDQALLQRHVDAQTDLHVAIEVTHDGQVISVGEDPGDSPLQVSTNGANGQSIRVLIPQSDVRAHTAS